MRFFLSLIFAVCLVLAVTDSATPPANGNTLFYENFLNGNFKEAWAIEKDHWGSAPGVNQAGWQFGTGEIEKCTADSITFNDGRMQITATALPDGTFNSGRIYTNFAVRPKPDAIVRVEAKMKLPVGGTGIWPSFLMLPRDRVYGVWPKSGEIDIAQFNADMSHPSSIIQFGDAVQSSPSFKIDTGFHTFTLDWTLDSMVFSIDGTVYNTIPKSRWNPDGQSAPFDQDFFILINLSLGGWAGQPDPAVFPQVLTVEYVKVTEFSTMVPVETCTDGIQNQGELGIDCGGPCSPCMTCTDGIQNQGELGIDCGGPCSPCMTCTDGIQNQGETGVDCGGPCSPCPPHPTTLFYETFANGNFKESWTIEKGHWNSAPGIADDARWKFGTGEIQNCTEDSITFNGGKMQITATALPDGTFNSGRIYSNFAVGPKPNSVVRIEAKIQLPAGGRGIWPAFWMLPKETTYGIWPRSGEIDIGEFNTDMSRVYTFLHFGNSINASPGFPIDNGFHTFALDWTLDSMVFSIDGNVYNTVPKSSWNSGGDSSPFDKEFYIILNLSLGGWAGQPDGNTVFPQTMSVEYVKITETPI